jgi:hypothetical protein
MGGRRGDNEEDDNFEEFAKPMDIDYWDWIEIWGSVIHYIVPSYQIQT